MRSNHSRRQRIVNFTGSLASLLEGGVSPALACATNRTAPRLAATRPDGIRYAVRPQLIGIIHDADECRDETLVQLHGGHVVRVPCPLYEVLGWFT